MLSGKMSEEGGKGKLFLVPHPLLHQPSTGQASNRNPRWRHRKPDLSSVPLQGKWHSFGISFFPSREDSCLILETISVGHGDIAIEYVRVLVDGMSL